MNKKLTTALSVVIVAAVILLLGVLNLEYDIGSSKEDYFTFTDSKGELVILEEKPEKVAVLFSSLADVWITAGGEVSITVGEAVERGFCGEAALLVDTGAGKRIDNELLISYEPDLVLCSADISAQAETAEILRKAGIPVAELRIESFDDYLKILKVCSSLTGNSENYQAYGEAVNTEIESIVKKAESESIGTSVLFIRSGSSSLAKAKTAEDHFAAKILEELGCYNIADNARVLLDGLSIEEILKEDPEHIFISTMGDEDAARAYMNDVLTSESWQALTAVKEGKVHFLPKDLFQYKPCSRWAEAYEYLYDILSGE